MRFAVVVELRLEATEVVQVLVTLAERIGERVELFIEDRLDRAASEVVGVTCIVYWLRTLRLALAGRARRLGGIIVD